MKITKTSNFSGTEHTLEIPVDEKQYIEWEEAGRPTMIQKEFPYLTNDEREFILTGITRQEWDEMFGEGDDEYDEGDDEPNYEEYGI